LFFGQCGSVVTVFSRNWTFPEFELVCISKKGSGCEEQAKKVYRTGKTKILRLHLIEKQTVSDICDRNGLNPNVFYSWQKQFFEHGAAVFEKAGNGHKDNQVKKLERQNTQLKAKLAGKDEVIADCVT